MTTPQPTPQNPTPRDDANIATLVEPNYEELGRWMDVELAKLVAKFQHLAAPNASKPLNPRRSSI